MTEFKMYIHLFIQQTLKNVYVYFLKSYKW